MNRTLASFRAACLAMLLLLLAAPSWAAPIKLARFPDYHDGRIVFSYAGDLWLLPDNSPRPTRLTANRARSVHPKFSPDGQWIAFSSARHGGSDVYIMPVDGGKATQLTFQGAGDTVVGWSRDSKRVVFSSSRGRVFPGIPSLYEVTLNGGLPQPLPSDWGYWGSYSPDGGKFAFNRHPMVWSRKHYRGSYSADLWTVDLASKSFQRLLDNDLPDNMKPNNFWPMWGKGSIYFVSDRQVKAKAGSPEAMTSVNNIWKIPETGGKPIQVTHHTSGSLFWPSMSSDGDVIVYEENFGVYKLDLRSGEPREVRIDLAQDEKENNTETLTIAGEADSFHVSPSGKRAVISTHGELFSIATDKGDVNRLTRSPGARDTLPRWSPDGKWIAYVSDESGQEEIWLCSERKGETKKISNSASQKGQPLWSPDSKELIYTASDRKLHKYTLDTGKDMVLASGDVIGFGATAIIGPQWSPDGKWVSFTRDSANLLPHVYVVPAAGGEAKRVTDADSYSDSSAVWTPDGKKLIFLSGTDAGNIGQSGRSTAQVFSVTLTREEKNPDDKDIDSEADAVAAEKNQPRRGGRGRPSDNGDEPSAGPGPTAGRGPVKVEVKIDFKHIERRIRQLSRTADSIGSMVVTPDSRLLVFTTFGTEGGRPAQSIWSLNLDDQRLTRVVQSGQATADDTGGRRGGFGRGGFSSLQVSKDSRTLYYRQGTSIYAASLGGGGGAGAGGATTAAVGGGRGRGRFPGAGTTAAPSDTPTGARRINFTVRVDVDHRAERKQVFEESWRVMKHRFYAADMHGVDWDKMKATYEPLLNYANDTEEMHDIVMMMIGEINASHTGISSGFRARRGDTGGRPPAVYPGFELEPDASAYYRVSHVYKKGPADKDWVKIEPGNFILAVNGQELKAGANYWKRFAESPGSKLVFTVNSKPSKDGAWATKITPISGAAHSNLQYEKWVADRRATVDKLSNGTIGYLHIRQMNDSSLRQFERDLAHYHNRKALIIDQRFNPGGGIDQELLEILQQKQYQVTKARDSIQVTRPFRGFFGPMVVMQNERSTSDAEVFPDGFRTLKLGKVVGMTTYGAVIGTGSYQLMDGSTLRTPGSGLWNVNGTNLENYGVPPDVYVDNTPADFTKGRDAQLEKAVAVLREQLAAKK